jgi:hypothetical protein
MRTRAAQGKPQLAYAIKVKIHPYIHFINPKGHALPVLDLLLMLPVDKRYASVIHLWNDPNKLSNMVSRQTYGRAI